MADTDGELMGWCFYCGDVRPADDSGDLVCRHCGERMKTLRKMTGAERAAAKFQKWCRDVISKDLWGPSPGGAAAELGCSRSYIDTLVRLGHLERSEYTIPPGPRVVVISARSIARVMENKRRTGDWVPRERA